MSEQIPSVGRVVHYQSFGTPGGEYSSIPRAATITQVFESKPGEPPQTTVGLCILNPTGMFFNERVAYDASGKPGTWRWPPRV